MNHALSPHEARLRRVVWLCCLVGAIHTFIYCAAFPFFSVVDEQCHLDLAVRYSQAELPRKLASPCSEALLYIAIYGTPEYLWTPESQPGKHIAAPPWTLPIEVIQQNLVDKENIWREKVKNHEASQPPAYYTLAGAWWWLGKALHLDGLTLLYWLRFLNVPLMLLLVWLGGWVARQIFPEIDFIRVAVPALIALLPQSGFYAINNDILSPICFGLTFWLVLDFCRSEAPVPPTSTTLRWMVSITLR